MPGSPANELPFLTPSSGRFRSGLERRLAVAVVWAARLPRLTPIVVVAVVVLLGLFLPGVAGAVLLVVLALGMATLTYLAWPSIPAPLRAIRVLVLAALVAFAITKVA